MMGWPKVIASMAKTAVAMAASAVFKSIAGFPLRIPPTQPATFRFRLSCGLDDSDLLRLGTA
jgi:hypothetical protein